MDQWLTSDFIFMKPNESISFYVTTTIKIEDDLINP
jgi:hypothetical protein